MTATDTEATTSEATPAEQEKPNFPDEMSKMSYDMLSNLIKERNAEVAKINAAKGDQQTLMEQLRETSTNPEAVAAREELAKAKEAYDEAVLKLDAVVRPEVQEAMASAGDTKGAEEKIKGFDEKIKPGSAYFKKMYGENLAKHLPALVRLKGFSTKGAGSSGRRVRGYSVDVTVDGVDGVQHFDNLASAAKYLVVDTSQVQEAFFKASGIGETGALKDAPDTVNFTVEYTETYDDDSTEQKTAHLVATRDAKDEAPAEDANDSETEGDSNAA
jgi:hypothetical protein